jgi:diguanylate cyclase (GGDEF)-like protein/PAS domain S-box-containing protein
LDFERCQPWRERAEDFILETEFGDDAGEKQGGPDGTMEFRRQEALLQAGALQRAIFNSANFSSIATDAKGVIQIFNVGAERMLGYTAAEVMNKITPADISDPQEVIARAAELSLELGTPITPGFEALGFKASRGIEDIYELTYIRKDGSRFPAVVSVTALRDAQNAIIGYLLIGTDNTARKLAEDVLREVEVLKNYNERLVSKLKEKNTELLAQTETLRLPNAAMTAAANAIVITDRDGSIVWANPAFSTLTDYTLAEAVGKNPRDLVKSGQQERAVYEEMWATILAGRIWHGQIMNRRKDGSLYPEEQTITPVSDANGKITHFIAIKQDITERKAAEVRIRHLNRVLAMQSGISSLIVRVRDCDELFREACRIAVEAGAFSMAWIGVLAPDTPMVRVAASFGDHADEYLRGIEISTDTDTPLGQGPTGTAIREKQPVWIQDFQHNPLTAPWHERSARFGWGAEATLPLYRDSVPIGTIKLYADKAGAFDDEEKRLLVELVGNISFALDDIEKEKRLNYLAYYDVLTGLANRTLFLDRVAQYIRSAVSGGYKLAVFLLDLERFKNINDSLGQPAGDELLRQVAEWLTRAVGDANLLARLDADHFAVVLPEVKQEGDVVLLVEKSMKAFNDHPFHLNAAKFRITAKVGIALFPEDGANADTLLKNAEAALKQAKVSHDRYLLHTPKMAETVVGKFALENQLREALDKQEFILYYQPKVNLASGKLTSAEALIRWNDPRSGLVPPDRFIPILEETGLIYEVGRWALGKAIEDYLRWRSAGLPAVRIAVNVSPLQLRNPGFIGEIEQAIGIDPHAAAGLELEITESVMMQDVEHNIATLREIRAMGISIAIDDFGTGFSSLSYLSKLPLDTLKIDRSFVIDMTATPEGLARVSTIIILAHSLKLKVVAEGVETEEQSRLLRLLGCDEMQGFLFSKPVPSEIFETRYLARLPPGTGVWGATEQQTELGCSLR